MAGENEDEDLEVEIVNIVDEDDDAVVEIEDKKAPDGVEDLRRQIEHLKREKQEAQQHVLESDLRLIDGALDTITQNIDTLKSDYEQAVAEGDASRQFDIQQQMANTLLDKSKLEEGKKRVSLDIENRKKSPVSSGDPVENLASRLSGPSANWVRSHPEFATDPVKTNMMIGAHNVVVGKNIKPDTDEYFREIEKILDVSTASSRAAASGKDEDAMVDAAKVTKTRSSAPAAAPVSRGTNPSKQSIHLTAEEREMATMMGMTPEEYGKNKRDLIKEGRMK